MSLLPQERTVLALLNNTRHLGIHSVVLGHERLWTRYFNSLKILLLADFLERVPDDEVILFTDSMDVVLLSDQWEEALRDSGASVLFSAEPNCHPPHLRHLYRNEGGAFRYLNSGCFLGYAGPLRRVLDVILNPLEAPFLRFCDQNTYMRFHFRYPGAIVLDTETKVFLSTIFRRHLVIEDGRVSSIGGPPPMALHFNADRSMLPWWESPPPSQDAVMLKNLAVEQGYLPDAGVLDHYPVVNATDYEFGRHGSCRYVVPYDPVPLPWLDRVFPLHVVDRPSEPRHLLTVLLLILFKQWERVKR